MSANKKPFTSPKRKDPASEERLFVGELDRPLTPEEYEKKNALNPSDLDILSTKIGQDIEDNKAILDILPDLKTGIKLRTSSVLSPKDLMEVSLNYSAPKLEVVKEEKVSAWLKEVRVIFSEVYKIEESLEPILYRIFATDGSYPVAVLPYSRVDDIINTDKKDNKDIGLESSELEKNIGLLTDETIGTDIFSISVNDNFNYLKKPQLKKKNISHFISSLINDQSDIGTEDLKHEVDVYNSLFKRRPYETAESIYLSDTDHAEKKDAIILPLPSESVIPVGSLGYYILVDGSGKPIKRNMSFTNYEDLRNNIKKKSSVVGAALEITDIDQIMSSKNDGDLYRRVEKAYSEMIEKSLAKKISEGKYEEEVNIKVRDETLMIMLSRALEQKKTKVIFIPSALITYMALYKDEYGFGKTLLDDIKILASLRALLTIANTKAAVNNSLNRTRVEIELSENDPDPAKTFTEIKHYLSDSLSNRMPLGSTSASDISNYLATAGVVFSVTGGFAHPNTKVNVSSENRDSVKVDTELEELLMRRTHMGIGSPPELVGMVDQVEFATSIVSSNLLLAKSALVDQAIFCPLITDHIRKVLMYSPSLIKRLKDKAPGSDKEISDFIGAIEVDLPKPDVASLEQKYDAFDQFTKSLEDVINSIVSADIFGADVTGDDLSAKVDEIKEIIKHSEIRKWCRDNNFMTGLLSISDVDSKGKPASNIIDSIVSYSKNSSAVLLELDKQLSKLKEKTQSTMEKRNGSDDDLSGGDADFTGDDDEEAGNDLDADEGGDDLEAESDEGDEEAVDEGEDDTEDESEGDDDLDKIKMDF